VPVPGRWNAKILPCSKEPIGGDMEDDESSESEDSTSQSSDGLCVPRSSVPEESYRKRLAPFPLERPVTAVAVPP